MANLDTFPPRTAVCVGAVVVREVQQEPCVLWVRQTYGTFKGQWSIPWGFVNEEDGTPQSPEVAAVRETLEEAGVAVAVEGLLGVQNLCFDNGEPFIALLFLCRHLSGKPTPDNHETDRAAYFSLAEMDSSGEVFEAQNNWLVRRVLAGNYQLLSAQPDNPYCPAQAFF
jgi:ADP-ribose pyrophosphatase YjhB (NUDIX family)